MDPWVRVCSCTITLRVNSIVAISCSAILVPRVQSVVFRSKLNLHTLINDTNIVFFSAYTCYGHWKNEVTGVNYVISTPQGRSVPNSRRYCFIMSQVNGMAQQTLHIASVMESCHPHPLGRLHWAFNITHQGKYVCSIFFFFCGMEE